MKMIQQKSHKMYLQIKSSTVLKNSCAERHFCILITYQPSLIITQ